MTSTQISNDSIDERIEKKLPLLQDSLELKLTKQLNSVFQDRFDRALKILSVFAIVMTGLGIKTFFDIRDVAQNTAKEEVIKKLSIDDPNSDFRRDVDKVIARGLIDSYLLSIAKGKQDRFASPLPISAPDFRRIQSLIGDPSTSNKDFSDAIEVLLRSSEAHDDDELRREVEALVSATDEKYRWMLKQPEKRAAIFDYYTSSNIIETGKAIIENITENRTLVMSSISYLGKQMQGPLPVLERVALKSPDAEIKRRAYLALTNIDPSSKVLQDEIKRLEDDSNLNNAAFLYKIASNISTRPRIYLIEEDPNEKIRAKMSIQIMRYIVASDYIFTLSSTFNSNNSYNLELRPANVSGGAAYILSDDLINGRLSYFVSALLRENADDSQFFGKAIRAFCLDDNNQCRGVIRVLLKGSVKITVEGGAEITPADAPAGVTIKLSNTAKNSKVVVSWTNSDVLHNTGVFKSIGEAKECEFNLSAFSDIVDFDDK